MSVWPAIILGFIGSLHCAGMCGPLALALPPTGNTRMSFVAGRLGYNAGRIATYCVLGGIFGLVGITFALAGLQKWVSIGAGTAILLGLAFSSRYALKTPIAKWVSWIKRHFASFLQKRTFTSMIAMGILNGFLPCGLVYVAAVGAAAAGDCLKSIEWMLAFGLGTLPTMLSIGLFGKIVRLSLRLKFQKLIPACLLLLGVSLILRGMSLGIPYLSPTLTTQGVHCAACRK